MYCCYVILWRIIFMYCWHERVHNANKGYMFVICSNICQVIFWVDFKTLHCVTEWAGWFRVILIPITLITSMTSLMRQQMYVVNISENIFWTLNRILFLLLKFFESVKRNYFNMMFDIYLSSLLKLVKCIVDLLTTGNFSSQKNIVVSGTPNQDL